MRKLFLLVLSICFFLGMATKEEMENVKEKAEPESTFIGDKTTPMMKEFDSFIKPEEVPDLYKIDLNPVTPNEGITTGHVIAYGHYIKPPYKVEIKNDTMLFISGVQIFPVLPSKLEIEKERREKIWLDEKFGKARMIAEPYLRKQDSLFEEMRRVYKVIEPKEGRDKAIDSVFKLAEADTLVVKVDTTLIGRDDCTFLVDYFMPGYNHISGLILRLYGGDTSSGYKPRPAPTRQDMNAIKKRQAINIKNQAEKALRNQSVIYYTHSDSGRRREYRLWQILSILKSDTLDAEEKIEKLIGITNANAGKELFYNFDPSEWPTKREDNKN